MRLPAIPLRKYCDPGNYRIALALSRHNLAAGNPVKMAHDSGTAFDPDSSSFKLNCLGHCFNISFPEGNVLHPDTGLVPPVNMQIVILNYLSRSDGTPLSYEYVTYRGLEGGSVYYDAFYRSAIKPLARVFGDSPQEFAAAAALFGGIQVQRGSGTAIVLFFLPRVPLLFQLWPGDEEFSASANILFDATANHYLHTEDLAAMEIVTKLLIKQK